MVNRFVVELARVLACLGIVMSAGAASQDLGGPLPPALEANDAGVFFDGLIPYALDQAGMVGAAVSVVKDGQILFAKGYGYADLAAGRRVDADQTIFRHGSVSKLFAWTAVMQLVERGKLQLDVDVNRYLDFEIPSQFDRPITLRNLLTHTAGFEDISRGVYADRAADLLPLAQGLKRMPIPARIFAPGARTAYSNYGAALAGYIVERVSGESFEHYVEHHIFAPLDMRNSTFRQPVPQAMRANLAVGYRAVSDPTPEPFAFVQAIPAGGLSATVTDMARFLIAHIQLGGVGERRILSPRTAELMHAPQFRPAPNRNAACFGFFEANRNGWRIIGHIGDVGTFHAGVFFVPETGYGIVLALNSSGERDRKVGSDVVRNAIFERFFDRYLPNRLTSEPTVASARADSERVAGYYGTTRRNDSSWRFMAALEGDDEVRALPDATIEVSSRLLPSGVPKRWREVAPLVYRDVGGQAHLSFVSNADGTIAYFISDDYPPVILFERLTGLRGLGLLQPLLYTAFCSSLVASLTWCWMVIRRRRLAPIESAGSARRWWIMARIAYGTQCCVLVGWLVFVISGLPALRLGGSLLPLTLLRILSILVVAAVLPAAANLIAILRSPAVSAKARVIEAALAAGAMFLAWFALTYSMVSFSASL
ncbi:MAG: beta-lactamase family protein [Proteobacteria bacterium]|nr:beta-lactamase family protein [Pseudomonadota bacterium]